MYTGFSRVPLRHKLFIRTLSMNVIDRHSNISTYQITHSFNGGLDLRKIVLVLENACAVCQTSRCLIFSVSQVNLLL